jgi:tyrosine-protein phosphatase SIW14
MRDRWGYGDPFAGGDKSALAASKGLRMIALHDARVPRGASEAVVSRPDGTTDAYAAGTLSWPVRSERPASTGWTWLTSRIYRLLTPNFERPGLVNFSYLNQRLGRGAQPGREGFRALAELGVRTVINLRFEAPEEEQVVRSLGMDYLYYPLDPLAAPTHAHVLAFLHTVCDPERGQIFFHCYHGADRTGVLAACYRLAHDQWPLERALDELHEHHFHQAFQQAMLNYVRAFYQYWGGLPLRERDRVLHRAD